KATLGPIMTVLAQPIDIKGDFGEEQRWAIHRPPASYDSLLYTSPTQRHISMYHVFSILL
ncbi:hypothetical protein ACVGX7_21405, partial [Enterobacter hormaechei]